MCEYTTGLWLSGPKMINTECNAYFKRVFSYVHYTLKHFERFYSSFLKRLNVYFTCRFQNAFMHRFQTPLRYRFQNVSMTRNRKAFPDRFQNGFTNRFSKRLDVLFSKTLSRIAFKTALHNVLSKTLLKAVAKKRMLAWPSRKDVSIVVKVWFKRLLIHQWQWLSSLRSA